MPTVPGTFTPRLGARPASGGDTWGLMGELGWQVQTQPDCNSVLLPLGDVPLISALPSSRSLISQLFLENTKHAVTPGPWHSLPLCRQCSCMCQVGCPSFLPARQ